MMCVSLAWVCYDGCVISMGALSAWISLLQDGCVISMGLLYDGSVFISTGVLSSWVCYMMDLCLSARMCYHHGYVT